MKTTVKQTKWLIGELNKTRNIYREYHLISVWWWNYWLYQWDFARNVWKRLAKWKIWHIFDLLVENWEKDTIEYQKSDFLPF